MLITTPIAKAIKFSPQLTTTAPQPEHLPNAKMEPILSVNHAEGRVQVMVAWPNGYKFMFHLMDSLKTYNFNSEIS
jgi:hypothetical protein